MAQIRCIDEAHGKDWALYNADCVDAVAQMPSQSVGFSVYSPPFGDLFIYSESECDMGNSSCDGEFFSHYSFLLREMARVMKPGRICAVHCSDLPARKWKDGWIGTRDFSGDIIRAHEVSGFHYLRRVTVWKDPVVEMTRTKALNLLHKQILKDSTKSYPGLPDYVLLFRAPGENAEPVTHTAHDFPVSQWQEWASPVWMTIQQTNTLNTALAKENGDEKHICPLQLDLIERAITMWSNPGDIVLSPFAGIGSEGYVALKMRRKFVGCELKPSYFRQAAKHLAEAQVTSADLFADCAA